MAARAMWYVDGVPVGGGSSGPGGATTVETDGITILGDGSSGDEVRAKTSAGGLALRTYAESVAASAQSAAQGYTDTEIAGIVPADIGAAADNDPRLSDARTPTDGSVTTAKIVDANVTDPKLATPYVKADGTRAFTGDQAMGGHKLTGLAAATANGDAVRYEQFTAALISGRCGDGSDGALTVGAGTTTVTTDKNYTTGVVQNGGILRGQVRLAFSVSLTIDAGGTIDHKGGDASGSTAGAVVHTAVSLGIGSAGGNGGTSAGSNGSALAQVAKLANGGAGGAGSSGAGGAGGVGSLSAAQQIIYRGRFFREFLAEVDTGAFGSRRLNGGAGGGGGGGNGTQAGGAGGAGGSNGVILTPLFTNNGLVTCAGGNGAAGTASGCGGGGGGNGGALSIMTNAYVNNNVVTVAGGTAGASGGGAGVAGSPGTDGLLLVTQLAA